MREKHLGDGPMESVQPEGESLVDREPKGNPEPEEDAGGEVLDDAVRASRIRPELRCTVKQRAPGAAHAQNAERADSRAVGGDVVKYLHQDLRRKLEMNRGISVVYGTERANVGLIFGDPDFDPLADVGRWQRR